MISKIICYFKGHKKLELNAIDKKDIIRISDKHDGSKLVSINICRRCGAVYSDLYQRK